MKNKWIPAVLIVLASAVLLSFSKADDDPIKKIATQLNKWLDEQPQEKIHLHLDKPYYAVGEDIWFKAYVTAGSEHRLSALSGILNVELINDRDSIKQSIKIPLTSGLGWGDFNLADTLKEGNYRIRAYTNWMRNAGDDYFFDKTITIVNAATNKVFTKTEFTYNVQNNVQKVSAVINYSDINGVPYAGKPVSYRVEGEARTIAKGKGVTNDKGDLFISFDNNTPALFKSGRLVTVLGVADKENITKTIAIQSVSNQVDVQFFPESGYLINGAGSKVAFKATGADGLGKDVKGVIKDEQGNVVTDFGSQHLGMGVFTFNPQAGKTYKAHITYEDGSEKVIALPAAKDSGYLLSVDNSNPAALIVRITAVNAGTEPVNLVAHSGGKLLYAAKSKDGGTGFTTAIPKSRFSLGIVQFTLFSSAGEPLNERLVFIQKPDLLKLNVSTEKQVYAPREKVKLNIIASNSRDSLVEGSFSIAVIDETRVKVDEADENTILSDILLTSDLKGYIEKPNYYFTDVNDKTRADLDVLMLTQGYRRFEWKQLMNDNFLPAVYQPEKTLDISGTVTQKDKPLANAKITLLSSTGGIFTADTVADAQGRFRFSNLLFADSARIVLQATAPNGKRNNIEISLDNIAPQLVSKNKNAPDIKVNLDAGLIAYLQYSKNLYDEQAKFGLGNHTIQLKEVVIKEKKQIAKNSSNLNGAGRADQVLTAKDLSQGCFSLDQCLQGRLTGVIFRNGLAYSTRNMGTGIPMQIIVDGINFNNDYLRDININDVATIEVLRTVTNTAIYGSQGSGGVIIITTKRGEPNYSYLSRPSPGVISYSPKGYYVAREFYSPRYDDPKTNVTLADLRSTIYWNPNIITDKQGSATVDYFNAGSKGTYRVVIEGINNDGTIGRQVYRYKVE